jgi:hypothetical protein
MKTLLGFVGVVLIIGTIAGGNLKNLSDWSTGEFVGYNVGTLIFLLGGSYLIYRAFKKSATTSSEMGEKDGHQVS